MRTSRLLQPIVLAGLIAAGIGSANAQTFSLNWNPRSGDVWVDTQLADMNRYGSQYRDPFIDEMVRYRGAPRDLVTDLLVNRRWAPGDVYYACTIAQIIGRPCGYVTDYWQENHGQGWGVVAKQMGIKPGSAEFHRLKNGFVPTYDRWSRPIVLDAELKRAYPNHGKAKGKPSASAHADHGNGDKGAKGGKGFKGDKGSKGGKSDGGHGNGKGKH
ncbi:hypothetical protein [Thermomonas sp. HDW16]|uniref:hypothetical protein n=1 Tax=Thermomonas sp. HDW16 TaxID=2714945 RepID=UPI00140D42A2|nr:hypothetical protein [Thermomonas sp. HDW16]QIL21597.1 hypothetical protein G7079_13105 [Thermomonas sp. HDW16]